MATMNMVRPKGTEMSLDKYKVKAKFIYMNQIPITSKEENAEEAHHQDFPNRYVNVPSINIFSNKKKSEPFGIKRIYSTTQKELRLNDFTNHEDKVSVTREINRISKVVENPDTFTLTNLKSYYNNENDSADKETKSTLSQVNEEDSEIYLDQLREKIRDDITREVSVTKFKRKKGEQLVTKLFGEQKESIIDSTALRKLIFQEKILNKLKRTCLWNTRGKSDFDQGF